MEEKKKSTAVSALLYFLCWHVLFLSVVTVIGILVVGPFFQPWIGLFLTLPYFTYIVIARTELRGGAHWPWFSQNFFIFNYLRSALQIEFVNFPKEATSRQHFYACHPHGVNSDYRVLIDGMFCDRGVPLNTLAASVLFRLPLMRELSMWSGCVDARRSVAEATLKRGKSLLVLTGGEAEQIRTKYGREIVYLKHRKGFVKLAIRQGVPLVPMYVFGVSDYFYTSDFLIGPRMWLTKNMQVCIPLAAGLMGSPFSALMKKTTVVFGEPLKFDQCDNPSADQLDKAHQQFMDALVKLFDQHKVGLGYGDRKIEIV